MGICNIGGTPRPRARAWSRLLAAFTAALLAVASPRALPTAPSGERFVPGEAIAIDVPLDTASFLSGGYAVDSAGFVDLPVLGRIEVGGKTREEVEEYLGQKLSNYLRDTHIRAVPAIRLTMLGNWMRQGQYYVSPHATVWEAVRLAGGMAGERNLDQVEVRRGDTPLEIPLMDEFSRGRTLAAAGIRSGDIFVIPVPRDNTGAWYWFREGLGATAQVAAIFAGVLSAYVTYLLVQERD